MKRALATLQLSKKFFTSLTPQQRLYAAGLLCILVGSTIVTFVGFAARFTKVEPKPGGILKEGLVGTVITLHPLLATEETEQTLIEILYDGIVRSDGNGGFQLEMATSISLSPDRLRYTVDLKPNLVWHDGKEITADDIVFTIEAIKNGPATTLSEAWRTVTARKVDKDTVELQLVQPYNFFLQNLARLKIIPGHIWSALPPHQWLTVSPEETAIGSGPFVLLKITREDRGVTEYVFERFTQYNPQPAYLEKVIFRLYPNTQTAFDALIGREISSLGGLPPQLFHAFSSKRTKQLRLIFPRYYALFFNLKEAANAHARVALQTDIDYQRLVREVFEGEAEPLFNGPISPFFQKLWSLDQEPLSPPTTQSTQTPQEIQIVVPNNFILQQLAYFLQKSWSDRKVVITIKELRDIQTTILKDRAYQAVIFGEQYGIHPDFFSFWHGSQTQSPGLNFTGYHNPHVDKTLEEIRSVHLTNQKFVEYLTTINTTLNRDVPAIFLANPYYLVWIPQDLYLPPTVTFNHPTERFANIELWYTRTKRGFSRAQ